MHPDFRKNVLVVDNTQVNRGVFAACNDGVRVLRETGADWMVYISAAVRFGPPGGMDFVDGMESSQELLVLEGDHLFGWHLIAFHKRVVDVVGEWDENFDPYGPGDLDYAVRIAHGFDLSRQFWTKIPVEATDMGMAHGLKIAGVDINPKKAENMRVYFAEKWGRHPDHPMDPTYKLPWKSKPLTWWPKPEV